jgi:hypothetical protein
MATQRRSAKCLPLKNWSDAFARHQIINQIIYEEYIMACQQKKVNWEKKAQERLEFYGINVTQSTLCNYRLQLKNGTRNALASSSFGGKLYEELGSRVGKEGMYKQIDLLVHLFLNNPKYIGLPANQLIYMIRKYKDNVVACEWDRKMFEFMRNLKGRFAPNSATQVFHGDIISYLEETSDKFSLFDFDLMQHLYEKDIKRMAGAIARTAESTIIVNVASCIGRAKTEKEYREIMPSMLIDELEECGCSTIEHYSDGYADRVTPMRYELLVVKCPFMTWNLRRDLLE